MPTEVWKIQFDGMVLVCDESEPVLYLHCTESTFGGVRVIVTRGDEDDPSSAMSTLHDSEVDAGDLVEVDCDNGGTVQFRIIEIVDGQVEVSASLPPGWNAHGDNIG